MKTNPQPCNPRSTRKVPALVSVCIVESTRLSRCPCSLQITPGHKHPQKSRTQVCELLQHLVTALTFSYCIILLTSADLARADRQTRIGWGLSVRARSSAQNLHRLDVHDQNLRRETLAILQTIETHYLIFRLYAKHSWFLFWDGVTGERDLQGE
jgi:hypothetical protein